VQSKRGHQFLGEGFIDGVAGGNPGPPAVIPATARVSAPVPQAPNALQCRNASCSRTTSLMSLLGVVPSATRIASNSMDRVVANVRSTTEPELQPEAPRHHRRRRPHPDPSPGRFQARQAPLIVSGRSGGPFLDQPDLTRAPLRMSEPACRTQYPDRLPFTAGRTMRSACRCGRVRPALLALPS
jgi:hypothetical protein